MKTLILAIIICMTAAYSFADDTNYCNDAAANAQWQKLVTEKPGDMLLQALHALRIGLCVKVEAGQITVDQATDIFEDMRMALVQRRAAEQAQQKEGKKL